MSTGYLCPRCGQELISPLALQRHRSSVHDDHRCLDCHQHHGTIADAQACDDRLRDPVASAWNALLEALGHDPVDWHDQAACRAPGVDPAWFWPERGESIAPARAVCATCPVVEECREAGVREKFGIWGGTRERERRRMRREAS